jgi:ammonia channel protein AmtB
MIIFQYINSPNIVDLYNQYGYRRLFNLSENGYHSIEQNITVRTILNRRETFNSNDQRDTEMYSKVMLYTLFAVIGLQLTIGAVVNKTIMPVFLIIIAWQQIFLVSVNDMFWT